MRTNFDPSIYFVVDPALCRGRSVLQIVYAALEGGVSMVQYRDKQNPTAEIVQMLRAVTWDFNVPLIVNDHVELAQYADGVHVGQEDMDPVQAREILGPDKIIGQTAFTAEQIKAVDPAIIDYIGTGPFFETKTDKGKPVLGAQKFSKLAAMSPVPVVGIGGITSDNAGEVMRAGADGVAMMRSISQSKHPRRAAQLFVEAVQPARLEKAS